MYPRLSEFRDLLEEIDPEMIMNSDLARRLQIRRSDKRCKSSRLTPAESSGGDLGRQLDVPVERPNIEKPDLLSNEQAKALDIDAVADLFKQHLNPGQFHFLKLLGFDRVLVQSAEGMYYTDQNDRKILDFFGGFGSLALGHNHPKILAARRQFQDERRHEIAIAFLSQYAVALAKNLAAIAPGDLDMVFFGSTGSEAVEAALKLAEKVQGPDRSTVLFAEQSFHGKTRGALSVTDSEFYQSNFQLLANRKRIPFGDLAALEAAISDDPSVGIVILETVQGGAGIITAERDYWRGVRDLCDRYKVLWIADEVQCGVGRTGRFFAFEHAGVVPDIVTLAKSLGGGKSAMGAMISRRPIYLQAYGTPKTALIHGPATFGGIGEACCTSIEALNVLYDEGLIENSAQQGTYLLERLDGLREKHPKLIKEVRGQGLMVGLEFHDISRAMPLGASQLIAMLDDKLKGTLCGFVGSLLLRDYDVLVAFTEYNRNVIRLEPPLIVTSQEIDYFVESLDKLLSRGLTRIVADYAKNVLKSS
jgi:acetylornithine/succinyldiaminopimelate/putrescine aminotransferase